MVGKIKEGTEKGNKKVKVGVRTRIILLVLSLILFMEFATFIIEFRIARKSEKDISFRMADMVVGGIAQHLISEDKDKALSAIKNMLSDNALWVRIHKPEEHFLTWVSENVEEDRNMNEISLPSDFFENPRRIIVRKKGTTFVIVPIFSDTEDVLGAFMVAFPGMNLMKEISTPLVIALIFGFLGVAVSFLIADRIVSPLRKFADSFESLSQGNIEHVDIRSSDEVGKLADIWNSVGERLSEALKKIHGLSNMVRYISSKINSDISGLMNVSGELSSSISSISNAVEEFSSAITEVSRNLTSIADAVRRSSEVSEKGVEKISELSGKMENFSRKLSEFFDISGKLSRELESIKSIVSTIEDISDQTNLLALNASIESARAGSAGSGFAVVAQEVRRLAEDTMTELGSIKKIVERITELFSLINSFAEDMRKSFEEILGTMNESQKSFSNIAELSRSSAADIGAISTSFEEQARVSEEIAKNMKDIVAGNERLMELINSLKRISDELIGLSHKLKQSVDFFKLDEK